MEELENFRVEWCKCSTNSNNEKLKMLQLSLCINLINLTIIIEHIHTKLKIWKNIILRNRRSLELSRANVARSRSSRRSKDWERKKNARKIKVSKNLRILHRCAKILEARISLVRAMKNARYGVALLMTTRRRRKSCFINRDDISTQGLALAASEKSSRENAGEHLAAARSSRVIVRLWIVASTIRGILQSEEPVGDREAHWRIGKSAIDWRVSTNLYNQATRAWRTAGNCRRIAK